MTVRYLVEGNVQGVGFRHFVFRRAVSLGLAGWVRNLPDGRVEVVAAGPARGLELLEAALATGPPHATVTGVEKLDTSDEIPHDKSFLIK